MEIESLFANLEPFTGVPNSIHNHEQPLSQPVHERAAVVYADAKMISTSDDSPQQFALPVGCFAWNDIHEQLFAVEHSLFKSMQRETNICPLADNYELSTKFSRKGLLSPGDHRLAKILSLFDSFYITPHAAQRRFLNAFIDATLPLIYAEDWDACMLRVMVSRAITRVCSEALVIAPRQIGKSTAIAMLVSALLLCVPGIKIGVFSTGTRASSNITNMVLAMINSIPRANRRIIKNSKEFLYISLRELPSGLGPNSSLARTWECLPTTSQLMSFPDNPKGKQT